MICPGCKHDDAYIGLQWVYCRNKKCRFYDARYDAKIKQERADRMNKAVDRLILLSDEQGFVCLDELSLDDLD